MKLSRLQKQESCSWREETWIAHKIAAFGCCAEVNWSHYDIMAESIWSAKLSVFDGRGIYWHDVAWVPASFSFCQHSVDTAKCLLLPRTTARVEKAADQYYKRAVYVWWLSNAYWSVFRLWVCNVRKPVIETIEVLVTDNFSKLQHKHLQHLITCQI